MLAPQAQIAAERREAREAGERLGGSIDGAVERIALDGRGEEDDEPEPEGDPAGEAPRIRAPEAEIVEQVAGIARDTGPEAGGAGSRDRGEHEERRGERDTDQGERDPPVRAVVPQLE